MRLSSVVSVLLLCGTASAYLPPTRGLSIQRPTRPRGRGVALRALDSLADAGPRGVADAAGDADGEAAESSSMSDQFFSAASAVNGATPTRTIDGVEFVRFGELRQMAVTSDRFGRLLIRKASPL